MPSIRTKVEREGELELAAGRCDGLSDSRRTISRRWPGLIVQPSEGGLSPISSYASSTKFPGTILLQGKGLSICANSFLVRRFVRALANEYPLTFQLCRLVDGLPPSYQGREVVGVLKRGHEFGEEASDLEHLEGFPPRVQSSRNHSSRKPDCWVFSGARSRQPQCIRSSAPCRNGYAGESS